MSVRSFRQGRPRHGSYPHKIIRLPNLIWRLLQPSLRSINSSVAFIDIFLHITHIIVLESELGLLGGALILLFQRFAVHLRTGAEVLFRICEEIMGASAGKERAADFRVAEGELGMLGRGAGAHKLLWLTLADS